MDKDKIIASLKACINGPCLICKHYNIKLRETECKACLIKDAHDLIQQQQDEIEQFKPKPIVTEFDRIQNFDIREMAIHNIGMAILSDDGEMYWKCTDGMIFDIDHREGAFEYEINWLNSPVKGE